MGSFPEMYNDPKIVSSSLLVPRVVAFFFFFDCSRTIKQEKKQRLHPLKYMY